MGAVTIDRQISQTSTLEEALRILLWSRFGESGTMRVIAGRTTGFISISNGYIRGAMIATSGEQGLAALNQLLSVKPAQCNFSTAPEHQLPMSGQALQIHIESVIVSVPTAVPTNQPTTVKVPIPPGAQKPQRIMPAHRSLTNDQLILLETYRKLTGPMDRAAFLRQNEAFVKALGEDGVLSGSQLDELNAASQGYSEQAVLAFLEFHRKMLGGEGAVSEFQVNQLRQLYIDLQTDERRQQFLAESGKLDETIAVERGDGIWQQEQEERTRALSALKGPEKVYTDSERLVAQDGEYVARGISPTEFFKEKLLGWHRQRNNKEQGDEFTSSGPQLIFLRPEVMGMIVSISLVGTIAYLVYSHVVQAAFVGVGNPDEDMVTMDLVIDEALGNEVPRAIKDAQILALVEGGGSDQSMGGGGATADAHLDPALVKRQTEAAKRMIAQGRVNEAKALLSSIVSQDPYDINVREILVDSYLRLGQRREARAIAMDGLTYARYKDDRAAMAKLFQKCIGDKPAAPTGPGVP